MTAELQSCWSWWSYIYTNAFVRNAKSLITVSMAWFCSHEKLGQRELSLSLGCLCIIVRPFPRLPSCISCPSPQDSLLSCKMQRGKWSLSTSVREQIISALGYAHHRKAHVQTEWRHTKCGYSMNINVEMVLEYCRYFIWNTHLYLFCYNLVA